MLAVLVTLKRYVKRRQEEQADNCTSKDETIPKRAKIGEEIDKENESDSSDSSVFNGMIQVFFLINVG